MAKCSTIAMAAKLCCTAMRMRLGAPSLRPVPARLCSYGFTTRRLLSTEPAGRDVLATLITKDKKSGATQTHHTWVARAPGGSSVRIARDVGNAFKTASAAVGGSTDAGRSRPLEVEDEEIRMLVLPKGAELLPPCAEDKTVASTLHPGLQSHAIAINGTADDEYYREIRGICQMLAATGSSEAVAVWGTPENDILKRPSSPSREWMKRGDVQLRGRASLRGGAIRFAAVAAGRGAAAAGLSDGGRASLASQLARPCPGFISAPSSAIETTSSAIFASSLGFSFNFHRPRSQRIRIPHSLLLLSEFVYLMADQMDTDMPPAPPVEQSLETVLFPPTSSTPPPIPGRQVSRLSHPPPPIDSPVLSAAQTPSKPSPPTTMTKENTPVHAMNANASSNGKAPTSAAAGHGDSERGAGAPVRQYLNEYVTPYLLEGMKILARDQPANPLETLGRYLIQQSQLVEANAAAAAVAVVAAARAASATPHTGTPGPSGGVLTAAEVKMEEAV
ncbi:hypothetical protein Dda_6692 [Drechslerella dactyloides]|uniref:Uncharacterized protein n=1 Tax=Drechslerella dactyloides TaxID=74499 RepID=A0AAD6ITZ9_DREDA|nr:hypothetical protein Dda_6692 [Drechslerella dactyloides]